ncbi:Secretory carrier-associated membrane protein 6 [Zea mays]|uniref:Secretory carrier-associated membrane protein 6 n=1 Tax=Zea mays TaxID=4577 RepID=A0A3L6EH81_MAIZE|nr:Secretory carrier-associated membrane protein 6 [Zea mays]
MVINETLKKEVNELACVFGKAHGGTFVIDHHDANPFDEGSIEDNPFSNGGGGGSKQQYNFRPIEPIKFSGTGRGDTVVDVPLKNMGDINRREETLKNGVDPHLFLHNYCHSSTNCISWEIINEKPMNYRLGPQNFRYETRLIVQYFLRTLAGMSSSSSASNATVALLLQLLLTRMISTDFRKECGHLRSHPLLRLTSLKSDMKLFSLMKRRYDLTKHLKQLQCRILIFVGENSQLNSETVHLTSKLDMRYCALVEVCASRILFTRVHSRNARIRIGQLDVFYWCILSFR